jgi:hypothetical protein
MTQDRVYTLLFANEVQLAESENELQHALYSLNVIIQSYKNLYQKSKVIAFCGN